MHPQLADRYVESIKRRVSQGDCPIEPPLSVETLEHLVLALAARPSPDGRRMAETENTGSGRKPDQQVPGSD